MCNCQYSSTFQEPFPFQFFNLFGFVFIRGSCQDSIAIAKPFCTQLIEILDKVNSLVFCCNRVKADINIKVCKITTAWRLPRIDELSFSIAPNLGLCHHLATTEISVSWSPLHKLELGRTSPQYPQ